MLITLSCRLAREQFKHYICQCILLSIYQQFIYLISSMFSSIFSSNLTSSIMQGAHECTIVTCDLLYTLVLIKLTKLHLTVTTDAFVMGT
jgi:hypothetical protein